MSFIKTIERSILTCDEKYKRETLNLLLHSVSLFHCATKKKKELKKKIRFGSCILIILLL